MNKDKQPEPCDNVWCDSHITNACESQKYRGMYDNCTKVSKSKISCQLREKWQSRTDPIGEIREYVESAIKKSTDGCIRGGDMLGFLNKLERGEQ